MQGQTGQGNLRMGRNLLRHGVVQIHQAIQRHTLPDRARHRPDGRTVVRQSGTPGEREENEDDGVGAAHSEPWLFGAPAYCPRLMMPNGP